MGRRMKIPNFIIVGIKKRVERGLRECRGEKATTLTIQVDSQQAVLWALTRSTSAGKQIAIAIRWWWDAAGLRGITVQLEWVEEHNKLWENFHG